MMKKLVLLFLLALPAAAQESPLFRVEVGHGPEDPDAVVATVAVFNLTGERLTDVDVDVFLKTSRPAQTLSSDQCTNVDSKHLRCRVPTLFAEPNTWAELLVRIAPREGRFELSARAQWGWFTSSTHALQWTVRRPIDVTTTADSGPGSLRAAIETANAEQENVPISIRFPIAEGPGAGVQVIRPLTPLPAVTASDIVIGTTNFGIGNVALDGTLAGRGSGLELRGEGVFEIYGLVIRNFPWDGISVARRGTAIESAVRNCTLTGNGSRGVTLDAPTSNVLIFSRASGNSRSGVFIAGATDVTLFTCFLEDNGASGVFVGPGSRNVGITRTAFSRNAHFGLAIARGARGVRLGTFYFNGNGNLPIDHGLDGFSGHSFNGQHPPAPHIDSMTYDPVANTTTVRGSFDVPDPALAWRITLYASDRVREFGERPEALVENGVENGRFTIVLGGQQGLPVSVLADSVEPGDWSTSELSNVVQLQR